MCASVVVFNENYSTSSPMDLKMSAGECRVPEKVYLSYADIKTLKKCTTEYFKNINSHFCVLLEQSSLCIPHSLNIPLLFAVASSVSK